VKPGDVREQRDYIRESGLILPEEPQFWAIVGEVMITDCKYNIIRLIILIATISQNIL
jgi:hypothetical protein